MRYIVCLGLCGKKATNKEMDKRYKAISTLCRKCKTIIQKTPPEEIDKKLNG